VADARPCDGSPALCRVVLGFNLFPSPDVNDPGYRNVTFDELVESTSRPLIV
jgi:hypothetical protein